MRAEARGTNDEQNSSGTTSVVSSLPALTPGSLLLVAVGTGNQAKTVTSIAATTGSGTFTQIGAINSTGTKRLELWLGRNFTGHPTSVTITYSQSTGNHAVIARVIDTSADLATAPTVSANAGGAGTSTAPDTATFTPAVDDLCVVGAAWAHGTASTARTHTGNTFTANAEAAYSTVLRVALGWCKATAAVSSKEVWTITSAEWAALAGYLTLAADRSPVAALPIKGRLTAALDAAAEA